MTKFLTISNIVFMLIVVVLGFLYYNQQNRIEELENKKQSVIVESLPENVLADIEVLKNSITEIRRLGPDSVYVVEHEYVPHESEVHYVTEVDSVAWERLTAISQLIAEIEASGDTTGLLGLKEDLEALKYQVFITNIDYDTYGTCLETCAGISVNENETGEIVIGERLVYLNRFGAGVHGVIGNLHPTDTEDTEFGIGGFVDGRFPFAENVAGFLGGGYNFTKQEVNWRIGIQGYFN